jgi:hypothetical protein
MDHTEIPDLYDYMREQHPQSFQLVWEQAKQIEVWPTFPIPAILKACIAVENGVSPSNAVGDSFAASFAEPQYRSSEPSWMLQRDDLWP